MLTIGLAGNPNCGKTTLFNMLTKSNAHVGNWPGVTVDRKEGIYQNQEGKNAGIIDLPGIYSLSPYTPEEIIARSFLLEDTPSIIINIVDATNIERNLYLTTQLMELDCPLVIALNMIDLVEKEGGYVDADGLSRLLHVPVIPISAASGMGVDKLMETAFQTAFRRRQGYSILHKTMLSPFISEINRQLLDVPLRHKLFYSIKILENDSMTMKTEALSPLSAPIQSVRQKACASERYGDMEAAVADLRYQYITSNCTAFLLKGQKTEEINRSEKWDRLFTNRIAGIPIFLLLMFFVFHFTFSKSLFGIEGLPSPGVFLQELTLKLMSYAENAILLLLDKMNASPWTYGLIIDGIIGGVGSVLSFIPQILCLFLFLSILEDSGYMARAAFLMDQLLRKAGLSGRAFLPLLMGFGCSVPAIMAARTLENEKDRRITMMIIPYMSCGAKLPIYAMFAAALFRDNADTVIFGMYFIGIIAAIASALVLKNTLFQKDEAPFILELPAYHKPSAGSLASLLWEKLKDYLSRAGTIILFSTLVIWMMSNFNFSLHMVEANSSQSMLGIVGTVLTPLFRPLGFIADAEGWKPIVAILTGLIAKEAVVSTIGILYAPAGMASAAGSNQALFSVLSAVFTPLSAVSFMAFNLLCIPCIAAVSALKTEMASLKWTCITFIFWISTAYLVSFSIYRLGTLLGF